MGHRPRGLLAPTATPGATSRTTTPAAGPTAGARTASPASATTAAAALPGRRPLERTRPDPQGAAVRPDQRRGEPRRGREGAVLLPRRHADALLPEDALQVPAGRVPLRPAARRRTASRGRRRARSSSCSTPASSTTTATSTCSSSTPRPAPTDILMRVTAHNRGPDAAELHVLPQAWFRNTWSWDAGVRARPRRSPQAGPASLSLEHPAWATTSLHVRRRARNCCSPRTRPTPRLCSAPPARGLLQGRLPRVRRPRQHGGREPERDAAPRRPATTGSRCRRAGRSRSAARLAATVGRRGADPFADFDAVFAERIARGRRVLRRRSRRTSPTRTPGASSGRRSAGLIWTKQFYPTTCRSGCGATRPSPPPPPDRGERPQRRLGRT